MLSASQGGARSPVYRTLHAGLCHVRALHSAAFPLQDLGNAAAADVMQKAFPDAGDTALIVMSAEAMDRHDGRDTRHKKALRIRKSR